MKLVLNNRSKTYNTETATLLKRAVDIEELGDGYERVNMRSVYMTQGGEYFLWTNHTTTDRYANIVDVNEWIVVVEEDWAKRFNRRTPDLYE